MIGQIYLRKIKYVEYQFFDGKMKDPYNDVRSAALRVVANNWKTIYSAEI